MNIRSRFIVPIALAFLLISAPAEAAISLEKRSLPLAAKEFLIEIFEYCHDHPVCELQQPYLRQIPQILSELKKETLSPIVRDDRSNFFATVMNQLELSYAPVMEREGLEPNLRPYRLRHIRNGIYDLFKKFGSFQKMHIDGIDLEAYAFQLGGSILGPSLRLFFVSDRYAFLARPYQLASTEGCSLGRGRVSGYKFQQVPELSISGNQIKLSGFGLENCTVSSDRLYGYSHISIVATLKKTAATSVGIESAETTVIDCRQTDAEVCENRKLGRAAFRIAFKHLHALAAECYIRPHTCTFSQEEQRDYDKIFSNISKVQNGAGLRFVSETDNPGFFLIDGKVRVAKTSNRLGDPIYLNTDIIDREISVPTAAAILVHEFGHQNGFRGIDSHSFLDKLGAKVRQSIENFSIEVRLRMRDRESLGKLLIFNHRPKERLDDTDSRREFDGVIAADWQNALVLVQDGLGFHNITNFLLEEACPKSEQLLRGSSIHDINSISSEWTFASIDMIRVQEFNINLESTSFCKQTWAGGGLSNWRKLKLRLRFIDPKELEEDRRSRYNFIAPAFLAGETYYSRW